MKKVLYISTDLGTPIDPRGISHYSVSLIEMIQSVGYDASLVVEGAEGYNTLSDQTSKNPSVVLPEIYRYFYERKNLSVRRIRSRIRRALERWIYNAKRSIISDTISITTDMIVRNESSMIDWIPTNTRHLSTVSGFVSIDRFYSSARARAINGLPPLPIHIDGFDLVIVDAPHYLNISGIDRRRVVTIVHDLIPLRDPTIEFEQRDFFIKGLTSLLDLQGQLVFVSASTQRTFKLHFSSWHGHGETIVYPSLRSDKLTGPRGVEMQSSPHNFEADDDPVMRQAVRRHGGLEEIEKLIDSSTPYFVSIVSDEPRKNIDLLIEAFSSSEITSSIVIVGRADRLQYSRHGKSLQNVFFPGYISDSAKIALIRASSGMIIPSYSEGFGIPVLEGATLGVPIICSDIPIFREIGSDLFTFFDPMDADTLVSAVSMCLEGTKDDQIRAIERRASVLSRFSQQAMIERVRDIIRLAEESITVKSV